MLITRYYNDIKTLLKPNKVLLIFGPRRVGKTTLLRSILASAKKPYLLDSGDRLRTQEVLSSQDFERIFEYVDDKRLVAIDEAQLIPNIGMGLKIMVDHISKIRVIATGSSSFELAGQVGEPLTGRKRTIVLYPLAQLELLSIHNRFELKQRLEDFLIFGSYPDVITAKTKKAKISVLEELVDSYLLKDLLAFETVKGAKPIVQLLKLLAFQIGSEVSLNELATQLHIDVKTVRRYLDLLEKAFVIVSLGGFSRNLRKEVTSKNKYYFLDTGVRNALVAQFHPLDSRNDAGQLWENFIFMERTKKCSYHDIYGNKYFWRTYDQQEIDFLEERDGILHGFECKWNARKTPSAPRDWRKTYPNATYEVITPQNYLDFIT